MPGQHEHPGELSALPEEASATPADAFLRLRTAIFSIQALGYTPDDDRFDSLDAGLLRAQSTLGGFIETETCDPTIPSSLCDVEQQTELHTPAFSRLVGAATLELYHDLVTTIVSHGRLRDGSHQYVDAYMGDVRDDTQLLFKSLCQELRLSPPNSEPEVRVTTPAAWLERHFYAFWDSLTDALNAKNLEQDLLRLSQTNRYRRTGQMAVELATRHNMSRREAAHLIRESVDLPELSMLVMAKETKQVYDEFGLSRRKWALGRALTLYALSGATLGLLPMKMKEAFTGGVHTQPLVERWLMLVAGDVAEGLGARDLENQIDTIGEQLNEAMVKMLLYGDVNKLQELSPAAVYNALRTGKEATANIVRCVVRELTPLAATATVAAGSLSMMHPLLGLASMAGVPVTYFASKAQSLRNYRVQQRAKQMEDKVATSVQEAVGGLEDMRAHRRIASIEKDILSDIQPAVRQQHELEGRKESSKSFAQLPAVSGSSLASITGSMLHLAPEVVVASTYFGSQVTFSTKLFLDSQQRFVSALQEREDMHAYMAALDTEDVPGGTADKKRVSVRELPNLDIELRDVGFIVPNGAGLVGPERTILRDVDLKIEEGEFVTITGGSGEGKTTLLRQLTELSRPTTGNIKIGGVNIKYIRRYDEGLRSISSYGSQQAMFASNWTLAENLAPGLSKAALELRRSVVVDLLEALGLQKYIGRLDAPMPRRISGGERKRLGLVRALLLEPRILLLDEPTAELDAKSQVRVRELIDEYRQHRPAPTVICVTHDNALVKLSEREIKMRDINRRLQGRA